MERAWSYGRKIGLGCAALVVVTMVTSLVGTIALTSVTTKMDRMLTVNVRLTMLAKGLDSSAERTAAAVRGYLLVPEDQALAATTVARQEFLNVLPQLKALVSGNAERESLAVIERKEQLYWAEAERIMALRHSGAAIESIGAEFKSMLRPQFAEIHEGINAFTEQQETLLGTSQREADALGRLAIKTLVGFAILSVLGGTALVFVLTRALKRQIGSAIQHIQSSSTELQTAASQQASGSKEQATAMSEITVTVQELLATAKQIAESAQRVAKIAEETATSAHAGNQTVQQAQEAISGIKRQVDLIVSHMLDLGKKSQQIGGVIDIINELAEQTNILAINATIEAAGAGDAGRRFGTVADEIRKLADRVGNSTKEIRGLIEEVRAAVHTTIMATEGGVKTVDAGTRQFGELAAGFKRIVTMVSTTTDAVREIELSTKQQSSAVEQVNVATANVAQATKESEISALQTVQTASDLARLSRELIQLIRPQAKG